MPAPLLATKFYVPPGRDDLVSRPRLTDQLRFGLERPGSIVLLAGPAGAGKTTLLSEFVAASPRPVAWLSLDERDNDPGRFWTYLTAACQSVLDGVGEAALALLAEARPLPDESIPTLLVNDLARQGEGLALVLDDYHAIRSPAIHTGLAFLLDYAPDHFHLVVSTRADPPWPLARYRARNRLIEIRARDLRFRPTEAAEFLRRTVGPILSPEDVAALEARTEGWAAGLQLAALSLQGQDDPAGFVTAFAGSHLYVADYLVAEVLKRQPADVQTFLLQTSILEQLNADLCAAVTGREDAQALLTELHRGNSFVIRLDDRGEWFRYHHLFADLLQARLPQTLSEETIVELHSAATRWYERAGFIAEAIDHAAAAGDFERTAALVEGAARSMIFAGRVSVLRGWLAPMPEEVMEAHPRLAFYRFWTDILHSEADLSAGTAQETIERLKALPPSPENDRLRGELMAVVCRAMVMSGDMAGAIRLAPEALGALSDQDLASRARVHSALSASYGLEGRIEEAEEAYRQGVAQAVAAGDYRLAAHTHMVMGLTLGHYGRLGDASHAFEAILRLGDEAVDGAGGTILDQGHAGKVFYPAGQGYIGLAGIHVERNELDEAERCLDRGMALCRQGGLDGTYKGRMLLSRLRQARGDLAGAREAIDFRQPGFRRVDDFQVAARQIQIALANRDPAGAAQFAGSLELLVQGSAPGLSPLFREVIQVVLARLALAQGDSECALQLLDRVEATARPAGRAACLIDAELVRALAVQEQDGEHRSSEALACLTQALSLAEPEGYVLTFLEAGPAIVPLLEVVVREAAAPAQCQSHARRILDAFKAPVESREPGPGEAPELLESLTPREMEVLILIAAGHSNKAIADRLVVTVRTVKKHAGNIYGKLNVSSRTQAVARARELGLLPVDLDASPRRR